MQRTTSVLRPMFRRAWFVSHHHSPTRPKQTDRTVTSAPLPDIDDEERSSSRQQGECLCHLLVLFGSSDNNC